jgi:glycosyltransferase involved in cell wall biosynthesis
MKLFSASKKKQTTLVVNGYNSTHGGGLRIFRGLVRYLGGIPKDVSTPSAIIFFSPRHDTSFVQEARALGLNAVIFSPTKIRQLDQIILYFAYMPLRAIGRRNSECLLNLGDYIIPLVRRQIYYFDWLYAVTEAGDVWKKMTLPQRIGRWIKRANIRALIGTPKVVIVQSQFVAEQMTQKLSRETLSIIPCPVEEVAQPIAHLDPVPCKNATQTHRFLCLSSFATHKNVEILVDVASLLKARGLPAQIILTLNDKDDHVRAFRARIEERGLSDIILNAGVLDFEEINDWFANCDALLLPTKLESFGLPYVESLARGRPILTSNLPFAHEVCKTGTLFFDPTDPHDIADKVEEFMRTGGKQIDAAISSKIIESCRPDRVYSKILSLSCL